MRGKCSMNILQNFSFLFSQKKESHRSFDVVRASNWSQNFLFNWLGFAVTKKNFIWNEFTFQETVDTYDFPDQIKLRDDRPASTSDGCSCWRRDQTGEGRERATWERKRGRDGRDQACNSSTHPPLFLLWNLQGVKCHMWKLNIHFLAELQVTCGMMNYRGTGRPVCCISSDIAFITSPTITTAVEEFPCHYSSCLYNLIASFSLLQNVPFVC